MDIHKGGLISESFLLWFQSPKKCAKTILSIFSQKVDKAQSRFGTFFGRLEANCKMSL